MRKRLVRILLIALILLYQVAIPVGSVSAAENTSILPPSNFSYSNISPDDVKLTWTAVYGATGYNIYEIKDGQLILLGKTTSTSYSLNNLSEGSYRYVVSTLTIDGESGPSAPVEFDISYPEMQTPVGLKYSIRNGNDIVLSWGSSKYAEKYHVYQISDSGERMLLTATTSTTYTQGKVSEGTYTYTVTAYNELYGESADTELVTVEVLNPIMEKPTNLSFSVTNGTDVTLKWQAAANATNYNVYEVVNSTNVLKQTVTGTSASFKNMPAGDYVYKVFSNSDRFGESAEGSEIKVTVSSIVMSEPTNVTYSIMNGNDAKLSWDTVPYATGYRIYEMKNGEKSLVRTVSTNSTTITKLPAGSYEYEIYAYSDRFGESEKGAKVSLSIESVDVLPPTDLKYEIRNGNDIFLSWKAAENAKEYKIYQIIDGQKVLNRTVSSISVTLTNIAAGKYEFVIHTVSDRFGESHEGTAIFVSLDQINLSDPKNAKFEIRNVNDVVLSWDPVENASEYKIYEIVDSKKVLKRTNTTTSYTLTNVSEGKHVYFIHSNNSRFGESVEGTSVTVDVLHPDMAAPANIRFTQTSPTSFTIEWDSVELANSYKVYEIVDGLKTIKSTPTATKVSFANMKPGTYKYVVHSFSSRFGESVEGASIEVTIKEHSLPAVENVTATISNGNTITLKWSAVSNATNYNIYKKENDELVFIRNVTGTSVSLTNQPEGEFVYVIKANSTLLGESPYGSEVNGKIEYPVMPNPEEFTYSISSGNDIVLRWKAVTYATSYNVYQVINGEEKFVKSVNSTSTSFANMPEGYFEFVVRSNSSSFGESSEGSTIEIDLVWPVMQAPENLTYSITNGNDVTLRWTASQFTNEYRVYQIVNGEEVLIRKATGTTLTLTNMPEGSYHYKVYSYSGRFGESPIGAVHTVNLVWPVMQAPELSHNVLDVNNIKFTWKKVDFANKYRLYELSGDSKKLLYEGTGLTTTIYNLTEATHSYVVTSISDRFGESTPSERIIEKIVYPIMQPPKASIALLSKNSARISWDFVTYANGYNIYELIDGKPVLVAEKVNNLSFTLQNLTYANHEYYVTSYSNSFGESKPSEILLAKLIVDTESPVTTISAPEGWVSGIQRVSFKATDNEVGVQTTYYSVNNGEWQEGTSFLIENEGVHEIRYYSTDKAGNKENIKTAIVKIDNTAPVTVINEIPEYAQSLDIQLNGTDTLSGILNTYYSIDGSDFIEGTSFVVEKEGTHEIDYYSIDAAGNKEEAKSARVVIDSTSPITTAEALDEWSNAAVDVTLTATDNISGVSKTFYSINGSEFIEGTSFMVSNEGINNIRYYSVDAVGNKEDVKAIEVKIDLTAPITVAKAPDNWVKDNVTVHLTAADALSGVAKTFYSLNGSEFIEGNSFIVKDEGIQTVTFYSVDAVGNNEEIRTINIKIDKSAPIVSADFQDEYAFNSKLKLDFEAVDFLSGIAVQKVTVNGVSYKKGEVVTLDRHGKYVIKIEVTDGAGNTTVVEKTIAVFVPIELEVLPKVIKGNTGVFTVKAILPKEFNALTFNVSSVELNGVSPEVSNNGLYKQAEKGQFKFNREDFIWTTGLVTLELRGYIGDVLVVGKATVEAKK